MTEAQRAAFDELFASYTARFHDDLAKYQLAKIRQAGKDRVHFAWLGGTSEGEQHYYRIQGPTFVVEWDNTQNDGNHVHSVWRDFSDDFGRDPLRQHLADAHDSSAVTANSHDNSPLGTDDEIVDDRRAHQRAHAAGTPHSHSHH